MKINKLSSDLTKIPVTDFVGEFPINGMKVPCAVLFPDTENPVRVVSQREVVGALAKGRGLIIDGVTYIVKSIVIHSTDLSDTKNSVINFPVHIQIRVITEEEIGL